MVNDQRKLTLSKQPYYEVKSDHIILQIVRSQNEAERLTKPGLELVTCDL